MTKTRKARFRHLLPPFASWALLPAIWLPLICNLGQHWRVNEQYRYGWAVPFLCVVLAVRRWQALPTQTSARPCSVWWGMVICGMAAMVLPVRLVHEPNPLWRLTTWLWALLAVGLTLVTIYIRGGAGRVRQLGFAVTFFLVAVPWPTPLEQIVVEGLTWLNGALATEALDAAGVPAVRQGNAIEVARGVLGLEEACSGVRSLQGSLVVALFLGEWHLLRYFGRLWCIAAGFALVVVFNLTRTCLLSWVAARGGLAEVAEWHGAIGIGAGVGCLLALLGVALGLKPHASTERADEPSGVQTAHETKAAIGISRNTCTGWGLVIVAGWLVGVEAATAMWYAALEEPLPPAVRWAVEWPRSRDISLTVTPMPVRVQKTLHCDSGATAAWTDEEQRRWWVNYVRWEPGRAAAHLARLHSPEACLPATGWRLEPLSGLRRLGPLEPPLPFRIFRITDGLRRSGYVFYCRSGDRRDGETEADERPTRWQRLRGVVRGRGSQGMTVLEVAVWGVVDELEAERVVEQELGRLLVKH